MISLEWVFFMLVIFFALIGSIRGWQREVLAMAGLIGSIAALTQFGYRFVNLLAGFLPITNTEVTPEVFQQRQFFAIQAFFICTIAFFSYQVVAKLAERGGGGNRGDQLREGFQKRFIGGILGAFNGYLLWGSLWCFLEFDLTSGGYIRRPFGDYVFDSGVITPPPTGGSIVEWLPLALIGSNMWLLLFFITFFIVIIALV